MFLNSCSISTLATSLTDELYLTFHSFGHHNQALNSSDTQTREIMHFFYQLLLACFQELHLEMPFRLLIRGTLKRTTIHRQLTMYESHFVHILPGFAITLVIWPFFQLSDSHQARASRILN
jgi:hypothetical protein